MQSSTIGSSITPAAVLTPAVTADIYDAVWLNATNGVGYETSVAGFAVRNIRANVGVCDQTTADTVLATPAMQSAVFTETRGVVNYLSTGGSGNFGGDSTYPGMSIGVDENNFVTEATGIITIPTNGFYTFGVNSDDGFRLDIGVNSFSSPGPSTTVAAFNLAAGDYPVRLVAFECGGGASVEVFAANGNFGGFNASFRLIGDTAGAVSW